MVSKLVFPGVSDLCLCHLYAFLLINASHVRVALDVLIHLPERRKKMHRSSWLDLTCPGPTALDTMAATRLKWHENNTTWL